MHIVSAYVTLHLLKKWKALRPFSPKNKKTAKTWSIQHQTSGFGGLPCGRSRVVQQGLAKWMCLSIISTMWLTVLHKEGRNLQNMFYFTSWNRLVKWNDHSTILLFPNFFILSALTMEPYRNVLIIWFRDESLHHTSRSSRPDIAGHLPPGR